MDNIDEYVSSENKELTVGVVAADEATGFLFSEMLKDRYNVVAYDNPVDAIDKYSADKPDALFVDWKLSHMDGVEFIRKLNELYDTAGTSFIGMATAPYHEVDFYKNQCVETTMMKPINLNTLPDVVNRYLNQPVSG